MMGRLQSSSLVIGECYLGSTYGIGFALTVKRHDLTPRH
jgi:hypothetical protein